MQTYKEMFKQNIYWKEKYDKETREYFNTNFINVIMDMKKVRDRLYQKSMRLAFIQH